MKRPEPPGRPSPSSAAPTCRRSRPASLPPRVRLRPPRAAAAAASQACGAARGAPPGAEWEPGRGRGGPQPRAGGRRCSSGPGLPSCGRPAAAGRGLSFLPAHPPVRSAAGGTLPPQAGSGPNPRPSQISLEGEERFAFDRRNTALSEYDFSVFTCESEQVEAFQNNNEKQS